MYWTIAGNIAIVITILLFGIQWLFGINNLKELILMVFRKSGTFNFKSKYISGREVFTNVDLLAKWGARELEQEVFERIRHVEESDNGDKFYVTVQAKYLAFSNYIIAIHRGKDGLKLFPVFKIPRDWRRFQSWTIKKRSAVFILAQRQRLCFVDFRSKTFGTTRVHGETHERSDPIQIQEVLDTDYPTNFAIVFDSEVNKVVIEGKETRLSLKSKKVALYLEDDFRAKVNHRLSDMMSFRLLR